MSENLQRSAGRTAHPRAFPLHTLHRDRPFCLSACARGARCRVRERAGLSLLRGARGGGGRAGAGGLAGRLFQSRDPRPVRLRAPARVGLGAGLGRRAPSFTVELGGAVGIFGSRKDAKARRGSAIIGHPEFPRSGLHYSGEAGPSVRGEDREENAARHLRGFVSLCEPNFSHTKS